jgi:uroporphyrinogen-III synthase
VNGAPVGITAARRAREQAALVRSLGGVPVLGAALAPDPPAPDDELVPRLRAALAEPIDVAVFLTGAGARLAAEVAGRHGLRERLRDALRDARVVARGPKPRAALRDLGIPVAWLAEPPRTTLIADRLGAEDLAGARVLVQGFGPEPAELVARLRAAGASVVVVCPYGAALPEDPAPAQALAGAAAHGELAALTFTSALAVRQWAALAEAAGVEPAALRGSPTLFAAVGPVTRRAMEDEGLRVDVEPANPRMGAMYRELARALAGTKGPRPVAPRESPSVSRPAARA